MKEKCTITYLEEVENDLDQLSDELLEEYDSKIQELMNNIQKSLTSSNSCLSCKPTEYVLQHCFLQSQTKNHLVLLILQKVLRQNCQQVILRQPHTQQDFFL